MTRTKPAIHASKPRTVRARKNPLRAAHEATGEAVERAGEKPAKLLYSAYEKFNRTFFGGKLGKPLVLITPARSPRALGDYIEQDVHGLESRIRVSPKAVRNGARFAVDVLLHEMIHAWQVEVVEDGEKSYRGHGPKFALACNRIGALMKLPEVGVKGRDGKPDCAHWPMNVRPAGYYPTEFKKQKTNKPKPPAEPREPSGDTEPSDSNAAARICNALAALSNDDLEIVAGALIHEMKRRKLA